MFFLIDQIHAEEEVFMRRNSLFLVLIIFLVVSASFSCSSTPAQSKFDTEPVKRGPIFENRAREEKPKLVSEHRLSVRFFDAVFAAMAYPQKWFEIWKQGLIGWKLVNPSNLVVHFRCVHMVDGQVGFAAGEQGVVFKTVDGGVTWTEIAQDITTADLLGLYFVDPNTGVIVGTEGTALRTTDGGATWSLQTIPGASGVNLRDVCFADSQRGVAVGGFKSMIFTDDFIDYEPGKIFLTYDGGQTWSPAGQIPAVLHSLNGVAMTGYTGVAVGGSIFYSIYHGTYVYSSIIIKTTDGGHTWTVQDNPYNPNGEISAIGMISPIYDVDLIDGQHGIAAGGFAVPPIYTQDGITWRKSWRDDCRLPWYSGISFADANTAIIVGETCATAGIGRSTDAGQSWYTVNYGTYPSLQDVNFADTNLGVAVGRYNTVIRSEDSGLTWEQSASFSQLPVTEHENLTDLQFIDQDTGYAVGWFGSIIRTTDGGRSWENVNNIFNSLTMVHFFDAQHGFIGGAGFFRTMDGGQTWQKFRSNDNGDTWSTTYGSGSISSLNCEAIAFGSPTVGIIVRRYDENPLLKSSILRTTDAGVTWRKVAMPAVDMSQVTLADVSFANPQTVCAVGNHLESGSVILRSTDSGATWSATRLELVRNLRGIHFVNDQIGFAVGSFGAGSIYEGTCVVKTTDGGASWQRVAFEAEGQPIFGHYYGVFFADENNGWVVGDLPQGGQSYGAVFRTSNGGSSWRRQKGPIGAFQYRKLNAVGFVDGNHGVIIGDKGLIVHTSNGGG
jgi:photosystem II stability/assembly factor-like uncharacterized protein